MEITRAGRESIKRYHQIENRRAEQRLEERRLEERRLEERRKKYCAEIAEQQRIEQNRRMNRAGQNVDRMV